MQALIILFLTLNSIVFCYNEIITSFNNNSNYELPNAKLYDSIVTDKNGRFLNFGAGFYYSIQNVGSGLYMVISKKGSPQLAPVLDKSDHAYFAEIKMINNTENWSIYGFYYRCKPSVCSGIDMMYTSLLGASLTKSKSSHPYYDYYWLQDNKPSSADYGKYVVDFGNRSFGFCHQCPGAEPSKHWVLKLHPDIKLNGQFYDFVFNIPDEATLEKSVTREGYESLIIENKDPENFLTRNIIRKININGYKQISLDGSLKDRFDLFDTLSANVNLNLTILDTTINLESKNYFSKSNKIDHLFNVPYTLYFETSIEEKVVASPNSKLKVDSYINWMNDLAIPFKAKLLITGDDIHSYSNADEGIKGFKAIKMASYKIQRLLDIYKINETSLSSTTNSMTFEVQGIFKTSFALNSKIVTLKLQ